MMGQGSKLRVAACAIALATATAAVASGPDIVIGNLFGTRNWGEVGDTVAYSVATEACNRGDEPSKWIADTNEHPVIAQNLYRHKDGRLEQIGMSWLKHGFFAVNGNACQLGCQPVQEALGVGCSDPYDVFLNGQQVNLGPRSEVNASTGEFLFPFGGQGDSGNRIFKRLQVQTMDVEPVLNSGARYFVEGQYVTADDALAGNGANNVSYREVRVQNDLDLSFEAETVGGLGAIHAWKEINPDVEIVDLDIDNDGRLTIASRAIELGGGQWRYEYAIHNNTSHRSARAFAVGVPAGLSITSPNFHDVDYHSGEPYTGTDWASSVDPESVTWSTDTFDVDTNANALRWGTMYNYGFEANAPPARLEASVELFRPGAADAPTALVIGPNNLSGEPLLSAAGSCPGNLDLAIENLAPGGRIGIVSGNSPGQTTIPGGVCAGVELDVANASLLRVANADQDGKFSLSQPLSDRPCGRVLQVVDLTTCAVSNITELP